jgi:hypothetical protein
MAKIYNFFWMLVFTVAFGQMAQAQVTVTGAHAGSNGSYSTVKKAFDAINLRDQTGFNILVGISDNTTETATAALNQGSWATLTVYPTANGKTISGTIAGPLIRLNGADNVTIDGSYNGITQSLTFSNNNATNSNNTIALVATADNNTIKNCRLYSKYRSITTTNADNTLIEGNEIFGDVLGNTLYQQAGIYLTTNTTNAKVRRNNIHDIYSTFGSGGISWGICYRSGSTTETEISNNIIYAINGWGFDSGFNYQLSGICIYLGGNIKIFNNTIYLSGNLLGKSGETGSTSSCIYVVSDATNLDIRNNILYNAMGRNPANFSHTIHTFQIYSAAPKTAFTNINANDYFYTDQPDVNEFIGMLSGAGNFAELDDWKTATGQDAGSYITDPHFTSATNLKPIAGNFLIGENIPAITTDYEGITRNNPPHIGAYEGTFDLTWTGNTDTDWNTASNWSPATIPTAYANVTIAGTTPHFPTLSAAGSCNSITIQSGASLLGNENLTVTGTATVERDISARGTGSLAAHGLHFLSSPVEAQAIDPAFTNATPANYDFYSLWEPTNQWVNYKNVATATPYWGTANVLGGTSGGVNFVPGKGYLVEYAATGTKQFAGTLNKLNVEVSSLSYGSSSYKGFHLLGNPFTSAINWNDGHWGSMTNVVAIAKIWDDAAGTYTDIAANGIIPALNGFMVEVTNATNSLTIPIAARVHNGTAWYKSTTNIGIVLVGTDPVSQTAQESTLNFNGEATNGFDAGFDSHFLAGYAPQFYSVAGAENLSTNTLPTPGETVSVPFAFVKNEGTTFSITAKTITKLQGAVIFTDLKTNTSQDLTLNPVYSFTSATGDEAKRFVLTLGPLGVGENAKQQALVVYASGNTLYIANPKGTALKGDVYVYNTMGQTLLQQKLTTNTLTPINLNASTGYYLVKVVTADNAYTSKVFIQR